MKVPELTTWRHKQVPARADIMSMGTPLVLGLLKDKAALGQALGLNYKQVRQLVVYIRKLETDKRLLEMAVDVATIIFDKMKKHDFEGAKALLREATKEVWE